MIAVLSSDERISEASWPVIRSAPSGSRGISAAMRVQRVEEEMGLHARLERRELRFAGQPPRLGFVALLGSERDGRLLEIRADELVAP